jgi:hypothetical protein
MTNDHDADDQAKESAAEERAEHANGDADHDRDDKVAATASNLPLVLGGGLLLLAVAGGLRLMRRRTA